VKDKTQTHRQTGRILQRKGSCGKKGKMGSRRGRRLPRSVFKQNVYLRIVGGVGGRNLHVERIPSRDVLDLEGGRHQRKKKGGEGGGGKKTNGIKQMKKNPMRRKNKGGKGVRCGREFLPENQLPTGGEGIQETLKPVKDPYRREEKTPCVT